MSLKTGTLTSCITKNIRLTVTKLIKGKKKYLHEHRTKESHIHLVGTVCIRIVEKASILCEIQMMSDLV